MKDNDPSIPTCISALYPGEELPRALSCPTAEADLRHIHRREVNQLVQPKRGLKRKGFVSTLSRIF